MDEMNEVMENNEVEETGVDEVKETNEVSSESESDTGAYITLGLIAVGGYIVGKLAFEPVCKKVKSKFTGWRERRKSRESIDEFYDDIIDTAFEEEMND